MDTALTIVAAVGIAATFIIVALVLWAIGDDTEHD